MSHHHVERLERARVALEGLSVGDALGGWFEMSAPTEADRLARLPKGTWQFTDDTNMALSIYAVLRQYWHIDQAALARSFAAHFDPRRGYGMGAIRLLQRIQGGADWRTESKLMFRGEGSFGNGGAMRVTPLGAYFADDLALCVEQARLSAEITHAHAEGIAGSIAAAVAAAVAWNARGDILTRRAFVERILPHVPESNVKRKLEQARDLRADASLAAAVAMLGNGSLISAEDTVGFCVWAAGETLTDYASAMRTMVRAGGDVDTNCAIVGGIVAAHTGADAIPAAWLQSREMLPGWTFEELQ
ncbi:MAG: ADP-ribosylglycohydrolase family protein [Chloroflexota bacterium]|nr:ADP-ribosylglycohydrolase family protein [Chloroflexota bacterium]